MESGVVMREFLVRFLLAAVITLVVFALASPGHAQQADEDPSPNSSRPQQQAEKPIPSSKAADESKTPARSGSPNDPQTQDPLAFTGVVTKEKGEIVLRDPVTKVVYELDVPARAQQYLGKQVKIIGKLAMSSNTIHVNSIEAIR